MSNREEALNWWKELCLFFKQNGEQDLIDLLVKNHLGPKNFMSLTDDEIEKIWEKCTT